MYIVLDSLLSQLNGYFSRSGAYSVGEVDGFYLLWQSDEVVCVTSTLKDMIANVAFRLGFHIDKNS